MNTQSVIRTTVIKVNAGTAHEVDDILAAEEPMEIRLEYSHRGQQVRKSISVTMRTPGHDIELATGFLYTEGVITGTQDVAKAAYAAPDNLNVVVVTLAPHIAPDMSSLERNFYTTSSCGVCGKASIEAVRNVCPVLDTKDRLALAAAVLYTLPAALRDRQDIFASTGGLHGCALFDMEGTLLLSREDVGRHNALDKLLGAALQADMLPLSIHILMLSGRASFELIQKAAMAGIKIVAAVGAPSGLAVQMAEEWGITLVGFLRDERFNIYSGAQRIVI